MPLAKTTRTRGFTLVTSIQAGCRRWQRWTLPLGWQGRAQRSVIDDVAKNTGITGMPRCTALFLSVPLPISQSRAGWRVLLVASDPFLVESPVMFKFTSKGDLDRSLDIVTFFRW